MRVGLGYCSIGGVGLGGSSIGGRRRRPASAVLSLTNAQKRSLPPNTPVGKRVQVTDGFVASGFGDARDGLWIFSEGAYYHIDNSSGEVLGSFHDTGGGHWAWSLGEGEPMASDDSGATNPWDSTWTGAGLTLTHPAVQELTAPSTEQGGVFVSGGTQDGVYTDRGIDGRRYYNLLGQPDSAPSGDGNYGVSWDGVDRWTIRDETGAVLYYSLSDVATPDLAGTDKAAMFDLASEEVLTMRGTLNGKPYYNALGRPDGVHNDALSWTGAAWVRYQSDGTTAATSTDDVATPDLATFDNTEVSNISWLDASDDAPADIAVTSVSQGELDAGVTVEGAGSANVNRIYLRSGAETGMPRWSGLGGENAERIVANIPIEQPYAIRNDLDENYQSDTMVALPWNAPFSVTDGLPPAPTVTRNDVASEANWQIVTP